MEKGVFKILYVNIKKKFKDFQLNVEFESKDEVLALLGSSGCGKSMTLKCIAGVEKPDSGQIILNGRTLYDSSKKINLCPQKRKVGLLFQNYALFPNMTLEQNILMGIPKNHPDKLGLLKEKIESFSLQGLEKKYPSQLSGGQQQRVALARMLVNSPELILLDEPFSALDTYLRWQLEQELVSTLKDYKGTSLFVSHNRDEVYRISNRIAIMKDGKIETISSKKDLFKNPSSMNGAILTGCENISRAKKIGEKRILALDWNLELECDESVLDNIEYVGIRAHHIDHCNDSIYDNHFNLNIIDFIEDLFNKIVILSSNGNAPLYIKLSKEDFKDLNINSKLDISIHKKNILLFYC
ncbi:ATP-binding cassette domain-containing protein [Tissierella creatinini]|nr:ATP-binding cassette domain-containing protein [Tissierella creatinini]TJX66139.1 ATP-binding cassette domain-containing protein [Soehngenia saccharolytica]